MAAKGPTRETFMADAERLVRESLNARTDLVVWRGEYPHRNIRESFPFDTVLVGMSDNPAAKEPPTIIVMQVWLDELGGVYYDRSVGADDDTSGRYSSGRLSGALEEVVHLAKSLPSL